MAEPLHPVHPVHCSVPLPACGFDYLILLCPGAWYFYPYGLSTLSLPSFPWWGAGKLSFSSNVPGAGDLTTLDQVSFSKGMIMAQVR